MTFLVAPLCPTARLYVRERLGLKIEQLNEKSNNLLKKKPNRSGRLVQLGRMFSEQHFLLVIYLSKRQEHQHNKLTSMRQSEKHGLIIEQCHKCTCAARCTASKNVIVSVHTTTEYLILPTLSFYPTRKNIFLWTKIHCKYILAIHDH